MHLVLCKNSPLHFNVYVELKYWLDNIGEETLLDIENFPLPEFSDPFYTSKYYPNSSTFKYIIGYKLTGVYYKRMDIALQDFDMKLEFIDANTILEIVQYIFNRGFRPRNN